MRRVGSSGREVVVRRATRTPHSAGVGTQLLFVTSRSLSNSNTTITQPYDLELNWAAEIMRRAQAVLIGAGAGMGVDSGLPDFRGPDGFWRAYPPLAERGIAFEEMANPMWFNTDPKLAWGFYGHRLNMYRRVAPHAGFHTLLNMVHRAVGHNYFVYTSNVDGHFQKAGYDADKVVDLHGSIHHLQCSAACNNNIWSADSTEIQVNESTLIAESPLPSCPTCNSLARPNILMFGDGDWISSRTREQRKRYEEWLNEVKNKRMRLAILEFGAGKSVPSVRYNSEFVLSLSRKNYAHLVRVNTRESEIDGGNDGDATSLPMPAAEAIEAISYRFHNNKI